MKDFFKDIFEYHTKYNLIVADALIAHKHTLPDKSIALFSHIVNAHQIWNCRLAGGQEIPLNQIHTIEKCKILDADNMRNTSAFLNNTNIDATINYKNTKGIPFTNTVQEILFHIANHTTHHRGQIIALFRIANIPPPVTDYIYYRRKHI